MGNFKKKLLKFFFTIFLQFNYNQICIEKLASFHFVQSDRSCDEMPMDMKKEIK